MEKLIITAAICGAEVTKKDNPNVPYTVKEIGEEAKKAYEAGASIIHLHVREDNGTPTQSKDRFEECIKEIRKHCPDIIIQPSTNRAAGMTDEERIQPVYLLPEMATLDCGTLNFGGEEGILLNTEKTILSFAEIMKNCNVKPEIEVFDKGMIDYAIKYNKLGWFGNPMHFNFVLGVQMTATVRDLLFMAESVPLGSTWTVSGIGKGEMEMAAVAILLGGHVRVGFEDNVYLSKNVLANSNADLVEKVVKISHLLGRKVASPSEARKILNLKR